MRTKPFYQLVLVCFALLLGGVNQAWAVISFDLTSFTAAHPLVFNDETSGVSVQFNKSSDISPDNKGRGIRWQQSTDITFNVPADYHITKITFTTGKNGNFKGQIMEIIINSANEDGTKGTKIEDWTTLTEKAETYSWENPNNIINNPINFSFTGSGDIYISALSIEYEANPKKDPSPATVSISETTLTTGVGTPVTLKATVDGNPTPTVQWYKCDDAAKTNATAIDGATTATYEYTPSAAGTYYFYCTATNENGKATSEVVTVNVLDKVLSTDATISSIVVNGLTTESKGNIYTATTIGATTITAVITTTDENATVTGGKEQTIEAGKATTITVTAEDGKTTATYKLNVTNVSNVTSTTNAFYIGSGKPYAAGQTFTCPDIVATIAAESNPSGNMTNDGSKTHYINSNYVSAVSGSVNGKADSNTGKPTAGNYFTFTPSKNGSLEVGIYLNINKELWISDGEKRLVAGTDFTSAFKRYDKVNNVFTEPVLTNNNLSVAASGTITFDVVAGKTYYVYCTGSKLGWYGMEFTPAAENYTLTTADADFYTLYLDYDATIPEGIEVYSSVISEDKAVMKVNKVEGTVLPANTAVLLKSPAGAGEFTFEHATEAAATVETALLGVTVETPYTSLAPEGKTLLTLGTKGGVVAFRKPYAADGSLAANRAYLLLDNTTSEAKSIRVVIGGDDTTGIREVNAAKAETETPIYNMAGQRVAAGTKGLLIKNGKKYINK